MQSIAKSQPLRNLQVRVGEALFRAAKIEAARKDQSLADWVSGAITEKLNRDNRDWLAQLPAAPGTREPAAA